MKYPYEFMSDLENLQYQLSCGIGLVLVVYESIENSPNDPKNYADALFGAYCYLRGLSGELEDLIKAQYHKKGDAAV